MPLTTYAKTMGRLLLPHTQQASGVITVGDWVDVAALLVARLNLSTGRTVSTALSNEVRFVLQASGAETGDDLAHDLFTWGTGTGKTACNATTLSAAATGGDATFAVASATGITPGTRVYLRETGTPANSEWVDVKAVSGTTVTPFKPLARSHASGITVTTLAERSLPQQHSLAAIKRLRLIVDTASLASGQPVDVIAHLQTLDSLSS